MNIPCNSGSACFDPASPFANISSELPDKDVAWAVFDGPGAEPPLGSHWTAPGCRVVCQSDVSALDALVCAINTWFSCVDERWPVSGTGDYGNPPTGDGDNDDGGGDLDSVDKSGNRGTSLFNSFTRARYPNQPTFKRRQLFFNSAQFQTIACPDGTKSNYYVAAGTFSAFSQAQANAIARYYARNQAAFHRICLSELDGNFICIDEPADLIIKVTSQFSSDKNVWTFQAGKLPAGMTFSAHGSTAHIKGTPSGVSVGDSFFTIRVQLANGDSTEKDYVITTGQIITTSIPESAEIGKEYSATFEAIGIDSPVWLLESGDLPPGITLDPAGNLSGTPTDIGQFDFTVKAIELNDEGFCSKDFSISVCGNWATDPENCRLRIKDYTLGLFNTDSCGMGAGAGGIEWSGDFPVYPCYPECGYFYGTTYSAPDTVALNGYLFKYVIPPAAPSSPVIVPVFNHPGGSIVAWSMQLNVKNAVGGLFIAWEGIKGGGGSPVGTYNRNGGCYASPTSVEVEAYSL